LTKTYISPLFLGKFCSLFFALTVTTGPVLLVPFVLIGTCQLRGLGSRAKFGIISGNFICDAIFMLWKYPAEEPGVHLCADTTLDNDDRTVGDKDDDSLLPYKEEKISGIIMD
jgi:hypothetical protein